jgi:hypothetical protein
MRAGSSPERAKTHHHDREGEGAKIGSGFVALAAVEPVRASRGEPIQSRRHKEGQGVENILQKRYIIL